jgi:hypothetical protein
MYHLQTTLGTFWIRPHPEFPDRVQLGVNEATIGSFHSPAAAVAAVHAHRTGWADWDGRPELAAPGEVEDWQAGDATP